MFALPLSFGGLQSNATLFPHTSSIFTACGGPGRSEKEIPQKYLTFQYKGQLETILVQHLSHLHFRLE